MHLRGGKGTGNVKDNRRTVDLKNYQRLENVIFRADNL